MSPLLSSKGRTLGKLVEGYKTSKLGQGLGSGDDSGLGGDLNYWGDKADGTIVTSGNVTWSVQNPTNSNKDGDMIVKKLGGLTINSGHTITTDYPCRGMLIYVDGDISIDGTLHMNFRGAAANPSQSGAGDNNAVNGNGLKYGFFMAGHTDSWTSTNAFNGTGTQSNNVVNSVVPSSDGANPFKVHTIARVGAAAPGRPSVGSNGDKENPGDIRGANGDANHNRMFGSGGSGGQAYETYDGQGGQGGDATCFSGGAGGGGAAGGGAAPSGHRGADADNFGGAGGGGGTHHESGSRPAGTGGAGNPGGNDGGGSNGQNNAQDGNGGLIMILCSGDVTIGNNGSIQCHGGHGGDSSGTSDNSSMGGGSGGGHIMIAAKGSVNCSGSDVSTGHYVGSAGGLVQGPGTYGERTYNLSCWGGRGGKNPDNSECPAQDMYTGTTVTRQGGAGGKGIVSVYVGLSG